MSHNISLIKANMNTNEHISSLMKEIQSIVNENKAIKNELERLQSKINPLKEAEKEVFKVNSALADIKKDYPAMEYEEPELEYDGEDLNMNIKINNYNDLPEHIQNRIYSEVHSCCVT